MYLFGVDMVRQFAAWPVVLTLLLFYRAGTPKPERKAFDRSTLGFPFRFWMIAAIWVYDIVKYLQVGYGLVLVETTYASVGLWMVWRNVRRFREGWAVG